MEKIFHARWWDYSSSKFNINGRICLETIIPFGLLGLTIIYIVNPFILGNLAKIPESTLNFIAIVVLTLFIIDNIVSFKIISNVRSTTKKIENENVKDNTEEISAKVKEILRNKSFLNKRLIDAFPTFTAKIKEKGEKIKQKTIEVKEEINTKAIEMREDFVNRASEVREDWENKAEKVKEGISIKATNVKEDVTKKATQVGKNVKRGVKKGVIKTKRTVRNTKQNFKK